MFNQKVNVLPNWMEKCMTFMLGKRLAFIDTVEFVNSSLKIFEKKIKFFSEEFSKNNQNYYK